mmetsp:Transcript_17174/g.56228  ORF Transcript_17174/g.56228 Transcript_17174/m.56228 type:complete len:206 (-) Transcript_17174:1372-1989(-)
MLTSSFLPLRTTKPVSAGSSRVGVMSGATVCPAAVNRESWSVLCDERRTPRSLFCESLVSPFGPSCISANHARVLSSTFLSFMKACTTWLPCEPDGATCCTSLVIFLTASSTLFISSSASSSSSSRAPMIIVAFVLMVLKMRSSGWTTFEVVKPFSRTMDKMSSRMTKITIKMLSNAVSWFFNWTSIPIRTSSSLYVILSLARSL